MKKNNINPFRVVKGKHIPLHQSKEGSTKIESPVENKPLVLDEKTKERFKYFTYDNKNTTLEKEMLNFRDIYTNEDLDEMIKDREDSDSKDLFTFIKSIPKTTSFGRPFTPTKNPNSNNQNVNKPNSELEKQKTELGISPDAKVKSITPIEEKENTPNWVNKTTEDAKNFNNGQKTPNWIKKAEENAKNFNTPKVDLKSEYNKITEQPIFTPPKVTNGDTPIIFKNQEEFDNTWNKAENTEEKTKLTEIWNKQKETLPKTPTQIVETPKENVIPDFSKLDFNTAFGKAKELSSQGIGQFKWRGGVYGTALNTKQDLGSYDTKYNTNFKNIYTGSGIAGETFAQRKANEEYAKRVAEDRAKGITPENPASPAKKGFFDNYEQYSTAWDNAKTQEEKAELTRIAREQDLTTGKVIEETPKKTSSVNPFDSWNSMINAKQESTPYTRYLTAFRNAKTESDRNTINIIAEREGIINPVKKTPKKERDWTSFGVDATLKGLGVVAGGYFGRGRIGAGVGTAIGGATADFVNNQLGYKDRESISGISTVLDDFVEGAVLDPIITKRILPLLKPIGNGVYNYGSSFFKASGNKITKVSKTIAKEALTENEIKTLKNLNPFNKDNYNFNINLKSAPEKGALKHFNKGNKYKMPDAPDLPDLPAITPKVKPVVPVKPVIPNSNYNYSTNPIVNNNPIIATANYKKPLYNTGTIPTLPTNATVLKPTYNNPNIIQPKMTSGINNKNISTATLKPKSIQGTKYKPEPEDLKFLLKSGGGNNYIKKGNQVFRKINGDWFEIKAQGGKLNPFKYADGGGIETPESIVPNVNLPQSTEDLSVSFNKNYDNYISPYNTLDNNLESPINPKPFIKPDPIVTPPTQGFKTDVNGNPIDYRRKSPIGYKNMTFDKMAVSPEVQLQMGIDPTNVDNGLSLDFSRDKGKQPSMWSKLGKGISTSGINAFDVINAGNMIKGYMGRNIKPPKRSWEDRQDIITPAQGMNPFQKQDSINNLQSQANLASTNNRTIDPRLNTASMLGIQQNTNQGLNQLNSQDSQMYQQDQQRMMGQKQNENLRMLQGKQNFDQRIQDENMRNYQMQQQASQQSINQGLNYMQMKNADNQKRKMQERGNNQMLNAQMYSQAVTEMQQRVKVSGDYKSVTSFDGTVHNFNTPQEAIAFADKLKMSPELEKASMQEAIKRKKGFKTYMDSDFSQGEDKPMRKGGTLEVSTRVKPQHNNLNPFKAIGNYTSDLMRMSTAFGLKNMALRYAINNKKGK